jgi:hypothetical protein
MRVSRLITATVGAAVLSIGLSGVVAAQTGITGNHLFIDSNGSSTTGAACRYLRVTDTRAKITQITARPPSVWWPDRNSDNNTEHGKVGWRAIIYHTNAGLGFVFLKQSGIQYATAYEGYPGGYDNADKAPFTNITVGITASSLPAGDQLRVVVKAYWFKKDGSVLGSDTHTVLWYKLKLSADDPGHIQQQPCPKSIYFA